jgi:exopolysaccharide biosynthesis polyprenyl glycosylphosphotransferase
VCYTPKPGAGVFRPCSSGVYRWLPVGKREASQFVATNGRVQHRGLDGVPRWVAIASAMATDGLLVVAGFFIAYWMRYGLELGGPVAESARQSLSYFSTIILLMTVFTIITLQVRGLYRMPRWTTLLDEAMVLVGGVVISTALVVLYAFFLQFSPSRLVFLFAPVVITALLILKRLVVRMIRERFWLKGIGVDRVIVVGAGQAGQRLMQWLLGQPQLGYQVVGFIDDGPADTDLAIATQHSVVRPMRLGTSTEISEIVQRERIDEVIIALPPTAHEQMVWIMNQCRECDVEFKLVPDLFELAMDQVHIHEVAGLPMIGLKSAEISGWNFVVKRAMDLVISGAVLVVFGWLFLLISLLIKLDSEGPVFFKQERVGRNGRRFMCYKFRTMVQDAEMRKAELQNMYGDHPFFFKDKNDPRRTRVGKFLRRSSLDELPQFFNVLLGEMSVVGPRPGVPSEVARYDDWHRDRLLVTPGLTGLWQVSGRSNLSFDEMVRLDLYYAEHWSPWLDIKIVLRTLPAVITGRGAY